MAARKKKDAISLGCNSGSLETSSLVVTGRRGRLPRNLQLGRAGFRMTSHRKRRRESSPSSPLEPFAGSILLPKVNSRRDITLLGYLHRLSVSVAVTDSALAAVDLAPPGLPGRHPNTSISSRGYLRTVFGNRFCDLPNILRAS